MFLLKIKPPYFISFEGGEGVGKTTLINKLKNFFEQAGFDVLLTREPGGSRLGDHIRDLLLHRDRNISVCSKAELFLFLSARAQHVEEVIRPALAQGKIVLSDRYHDSSVAYQGYARGLGMENVESLSHFASDGLIPNLTFFLDLDPKIGLKRASSVGKPDLIEEQKMEFHALVRKAFIEIAKKEPKRVKFIDASETADHVFSQVLKVFEA